MVRRFGTVELVPPMVIGLFTRRRTPPGRQTLSKSTPRRRRWPWFVLGFVFLLGVFFYFTSAKTLGEPITMEFGAAEPAFQDSMGALLGPGFIKGNRVETLINGVEVFPAMIEAIRRAQHSITMETYIWSSGVVNDQFVEALSERARQGVKVHALADGFGTLNLEKSEMRRMKDAGIEFVFYEREHWYRAKLNFNHHTHRKLLIVDGRVGFTGGVCIDDAWYGDANSMKEWRDTQFRVEGPVVKQMQAIFATNWLQTTGRLLQGPDYFPGDERRGDTFVQSWESGPGEGAEHARMAFLLAIAAARNSIRISHAYFVPDDLAIEMLVVARERGVDIEVIVPLKNDSAIGRGAARSRWGKLLAAGVKFYQYEPALYHCKVMIVDDVFVTAGSVNFDNRSFRLNDESNINVLDREFAGEQLRIFAEDKADSRPLTLEAFRARPWWVKLSDHTCGLVRSQL